MSSITLRNEIRSIKPEVDYNFQRVMQYLTVCSRVLVRDDFTWWDGCYGIVKVLSWESPLFWFPSI